MTYVNVGTLGTRAGQRDELVSLLTQRSDRLKELGCIAYEVGVSEDAPDTVFVMELWDSAAAHRASLEQSDVVDAIASARPLLDGSYGGFRFEIVGSPLRD